MTGPWDSVGEFTSDAYDGAGDVLCESELRVAPAGREYLDTIKNAQRVIGEYGGNFPGGRTDRRPSR